MSYVCCSFFFVNDTATTEIYTYCHTLSLHDALPICFRSWRAGLCIVLPLVLVTELGHSLMVHLGIGMKVNTLTVVALGVGIGVDYAIYIFARMNEAMQQGRTVRDRKSTRLNSSH